MNLMLKMIFATVLGKRMGYGWRGDLGLHPKKSFFSILYIVPFES